MTTSTDLSDFLTDYAFDVPTELIAQEPAQRREDAKLLIVRREPSGGLPRFEDLVVSELPDFLARNAALCERTWVRNRSRVFPARFYARRPTGGKHEIVLLEAIDRERHRWRAIIRGSGDFNYPQTLFAEGPAPRAFTFTSPATGIVDFSASGVDAVAWLWEAGEMPLPPYIKKRDRRRDLDRYQSVWADPEHSRSAAAPTASLHFSEDLLRRLPAFPFADVYLHVGLGTFEPVRTPKLSEHTLHWEQFFVPAAEIARLASEPAKVCIGTTALRCLESLPPELLQRAARAHPGETLAVDDTLECALDAAGNLRGRTRLFVRPGHRFTQTAHLWTNFHLPESTLFVLVACFAGSRTLALEAYRHAISKGYRFFSFGDASLWV